jgi:hypothetical protein
MSQVRLTLCLAGATVVLFCATLALNELIFTHLEFVRGVNWIYLPAGVRLLCILLFAEAGAIGLLIASWLVCFFYFFPDDPIRSFMGGIIAAAAPYLVYRVMLVSAGARTSLADLTPLRLLAYAVAFSIASPLLHHIWFAVQGTGNLLHSFLAMVQGDLAGTLLVLYGAKGALALTGAMRRR